MFRRRALVWVATLAGAATAIAAPAPASLDVALREHAGAMRKPVDCGRTPVGDQWRVLRFNLRDRHLVFVELVRNHPNGTTERLAAQGLELFNEPDAHLLARGIRCKVGDGKIHLTMRAVHDASGSVYGFPEVELAPDGTVTEYLGSIVVSS